MTRKELTKTSKFLIFLLAAGEALSYGVGTPRGIFQAWEGRDHTFRNILYNLHKRGVIKIIDKNNQRFVKLTKKGQMEALFTKAQIHKKPLRWDGKWRILVFDIPEESHDKRNKLRALLKKNGFIKLQVSVYISPYPLHRDAINYLVKSGLIEYIRIAKIEEMDNDSDLRKKFGLLKR
jgi:phenylacetic acid degradation operon negative regulatory protein